MRISSRHETCTGPSPNPRISERAVGRPPRQGRTTLASGTSEAASSDMGSPKRVLITGGSDVENTDES